MAARIFNGLFLWLCLTGIALAAMPPAQWPASPETQITTSADQKPAAIIFFNDGSNIAKDHAAIIKSMSKEISSDFGLPIENHELAKEDNLPDEIEKIADTDTGLIVIIQPHNIDALMKLPPLYPDIKFTIIGSNVPLFFTNARSILFKDQEGAFLMGMLAALQSHKNTVGFISKEDNAYTRNLAYAFGQGAKYVKPDVRLIQRLGTRTGSKAAQQVPDERADIIFILDDELAEQTISSARQRKQFIISFDRDLTSAYPGVVLTSLIKHYDLALYWTLRSYMQNSWKPGSQSMGIGNSFIDYALGNSNKAQFSQSVIDQAERAKDLVSQGAIQIVPLTQ